MRCGDLAHVRGPCGSDFTYRRGVTRRLGLVAGGTGITPMWQVVQSILRDPADDTRIHLVYASRECRGLHEWPPKCAVRVLSVFGWQSSMVH